MKKKITKLGKWAQAALNLKMRNLHDIIDLCPPFVLWGASLLPPESRMMGSESGEVGIFGQYAEQCLEENPLVPGSGREAGFREGK